jgi:hypothetical protein
VASKFASFAHAERSVRQRNSAQLHPLVFDAIVGLALWLVLAAWLFFSGPDYSRIVLVVVSGLALTAIGISYVLWRISWKHGATRIPGEEEPFHDWRTGEFQTWQARLEGREALIQILLPIAAVAIGMTAIGIVFCLT